MSPSIGFRGVSELLLSSVRQGSFTLLSIKSFPGKLDSAHLLLSTAVADSTLFERTGSSDYYDDNPSLVHFFVCPTHPSISCIGTTKVPHYGCEPSPQLCSTDELHSVLSKYFHEDVSCAEDGRPFQRFGHPLTVDTLTAVHRQSENLVIATMWYNLAQVIHMHAAKLCRRCLLEQADYLYRAATVAAARAVGDDQCSEGDVAPLLLAIWNNQAYIRCWEIIDQRMARGLIQEMNRFLHTTVKELLKRPGPHLHSEHYYFFYSNVMLNKNEGLFNLASAA